MNTPDNSYFITETYTLFTRYYAGSRYIKETEGSTTTEFTWIGGDAYSAPVVAEKVGSTTNYYYLLRNYLGNITHKVNTSNNVVAEYSFDAWGRRRDKDDWGYTLSSEPDLLADRAFTSHEYLPWFNIVNMNGRLYNPVVGRFLSPDENVQMPDFTQNFNRYSYCVNNPLIYTDPDGEWFLIDDAISFVVGGIINVIFNAGEIDNFWEGLGYFASGGAGAWIAVQSFGLAAPVGAAITTFGNSTLETNFLTKENDYSFSSITSAQWEKIGKKTLIGGVSGYVGGKLGEKISNKLINSFNIESSLKRYSKSSIKLSDTDLLITRAYNSLFSNTLKSY